MNYRVKIIMNEMKLKDLFVSSLESGHILNSKGGSVSFATHEDEIRIKSEGYFRQFDLVIAVLHRNGNNGSKEEDSYDNIVMRTGQLAEIAKSERCRIDSISFYPVELKSNSDILDERLPNQILNAILTFGRSVVVLDEKHVKRNSINLLRVLPATVIGYTGRDDYFRVLSVFDRFIETGMFNLPKRSFASMLYDNGIIAGADKIYRRLSNLERINQKIVFNQLFKSNTGFLKEEIEFLRGFSEINGKMSYRSSIRTMIKESKNLKVTDYLSCPET